MNWYKLAQYKEYPPIETDTLRFKDNIIDPEQNLTGTDLNQYEEKVYDLFERTDVHRTKILEDFYNKKRKKKTMMSWSVVPKARLMRIWLDYGKIGLVRDIKGMQFIADRMIEILARLRASNELSGHGSGGYSDEETEEITGYKIPQDKANSNDFYWHYLETPYGTPVSDYGLPKLEQYADKLLRAQTAEQQLFWVDQMLNVVHQRGDLAALFVEGGQNTLTEIANQ